jgi:ketosteroid isomerase-like protein
VKALVRWRGLPRLLARRNQPHRYTTKLLDPAIVYTQNGSEVPDFAGEWRGLDGIRAAVTFWLDAWKDISYTLEDVVSIDDKIVVREAMSARGARSNLDASQTLAHVLQVRDGKVIRWDAYWNPAEAPVSQPST